MLLSAGDNRFGAGGGSVIYVLTTNDANVAAGGRLIVQANTLRADELLNFSGFNETDGSFQIFSGANSDFIAGSQTADDIWGGAGNDVIEGQGGADTLRGGVGNDSFRYFAARDSTNAARDQLLDFTLGDRIDLNGLAANTGGGNFTFIGGAGQTGARQVQVMQTGATATVRVFVDGDANADLVIDVTVADGHTLTPTDFNGVNNPNESTFDPTVGILDGGGDPAEHDMSFLGKRNQQVARNENVGISPDAWRTETVYDGRSVEAVHWHKHAAIVPADDLLAIASGTGLVV